MHVARRIITFVTMLAVSGAVMAGVASTASAAPAHAGSHSVMSVSQEMNLAAAKAGPGKAYTVNLGGGMIGRHLASQKRAQMVLCLKSQSGLCIVSEGAGNQVRVEFSGWVNFNIGSSGGHSVFTNANGHPLRMENSPYRVTLGNGGFSSGDDGAKWDNHTTLNDVTWTTVAHPSEYAGAFGNPATDNPVWGDTGVGDSFYKIGKNL